MGVAGCGKSTVGEAVAARLGAQYFDGDHLHPENNIAKMSAGTPLSDADRAPWLRQVGRELSGVSEPVLIGCSALKRKYRDIIRDAANNPVVFLHLSGAREVIEARMSARTGHFMPVSLLDSQFKALEVLEPDEDGIEVSIDKSFDAVVAECAQELRDASFG